MKVTNFLNSKDKLDIFHAINILTREALGRNTVESIDLFEHHSQQILGEFYSDPQLQYSSSYFDLEKLPSFKIWSKQLQDEELLVKYMPFINAKMLEGDVVSYILYNSIYSELGKSELLITKDTLNENNMLHQAFDSSDLGLDTQAILHAELWINSSEGKKILCSGVIYQTDIELLVGSEC